MSLRIYTSPLGQGNEYSFAVNLNNAVASGTVTFPTLPKIPFACHMTVACPAAGVHITAAPVAGTLTTSECDFTLSGLTTNTDYVLYVTIKF